MSMNTVYGYSYAARGIMKGHNTIKNNVRGASKSFDVYTLNIKLVIFYTSIIHFKVPIWKW